MPNNTDFAIRRMAPRDVDVVLSLWSRRFGGTPETQDQWIEVSLDADHPAVAFVAEAAANDDPVGFSFLDVAGREHTRDYLGLQELGLAPGLDARNGIFHLSCVRVEWEGRGIGSAFYRRRLRVLSDRGVERAFGISWHRPDCSHDSRALFAKWGFTKVATVSNYYARTGGRDNCPVCGGECHCTASLFAIDGIRS